MKCHSLSTYLGLRLGLGLRRRRLRAGLGLGLGLALRLRLRRRLRLTNRKQQAYKRTGTPYGDVRADKREDFANIPTWTTQIRWDFPALAGWEGRRGRKR